MKKSREQKNEEALHRQVKYDSLSVSQKRAKLDKKLGKGIGAKKERRRLVNK